MRDESNRVPDGRAGWRNLTIRTVVPLAILLTVLELAGRVGPVWAGLLGTFPCTLVAVLVATAIEAGPGVAAATARAFPLGNFSMVSFVAVFGWLCQPLGVTAGLGLGYVGALATLIGMEVARRWARSASNEALASRPAVRAVQPFAAVLPWRGF